MFLLKWFTSSHLEDPPPSDTGTTTDSLDSLTDTVTIMDMPDLVMRKILKDVDLVSMLTLRKVNRAFQYFIDDTQPKFDLSFLSVCIYDPDISMRLLESKTERKIDLEFKQHNQKSFVEIEIDGRCEDRIQCANHFEQFEICLDGILKNLKVPLKMLQIRVIPMISLKFNKSIFGFLGCCASRRSLKISSNDPYDSDRKVTYAVLDSLERILKSVKFGEIRVEKFKFLFFKLKNVPRILEIMKPTALEDRVVHGILKSEMKKKGKVCNMRFELGNSEYVFHPYIFVPKLNAQDLLFFKNILLTSPHRESLHITFYQISSNEELTSVLGDWENHGRWIFEDTLSLEIEND